MNNNIPKKEIEKDLEKFRKFEAMAQSEGGKELSKLALKDIIYVLDTISSKATELTHVEYIGLGIKLNEKLATYRLIKNAPKNVNLAEEALKEALDEED